MAQVHFPAEVLEPIKKHLEQKLKQLMARQKDLKKEDPFADESRLNDNAAADIEASEQFGHARVEAMTKEVEAGIESVRQALEKIAEGTYGTCENCNAMIDTDRLAIDPTARLCVACQQKQQSENGVMR